MRCLTACDHDTSSDASRPASRPLRGRFASARESNASRFASAKRTRSSHTASGRVRCVRTLDHRRRAHSPGPITSRSVALHCLSTQSAVLQRNGTNVIRPGFRTVAAPRPVCAPSPRHACGHSGHAVSVLGWCCRVLSGSPVGSAPLRLARVRLARVGCRHLRSRFSPLRPCSRGSAALAVHIDTRWVSSSPRRFWTPRGRFAAPYVRVAATRPRGFRWLRVSRQCRLPILTRRRLCIATARVGGL